MAENASSPPLPRSRPIWGRATLTVVFVRIASENAEALTTSGTPGNFA